MTASTPHRPATPLLVLSTAKAGGAERALGYLVRDLPRQGFDPTVLLLESGPLEPWLRRAGCQRVKVASSAADVPLLARRLIDEAGAGLVLSSKWRTHPWGAAAAQDAGIPAVCWQHDIARPTPEQLAAAAHPAAAIVCASRFSAQAQRQLTPVAPLVQIEPGVPVAALAARASMRDRGAPWWERPPVVGILGRLAHFKRQHVFLRAAALVARRRPEVRFLVIGGAVLGNEGDYPARLKRLTAELGLTDRVRFVGHQPDVAPWLSALDVLVSANEGEPFGLAVVEAMSLGVPVVATNQGGPVEIIGDSDAGRLVPPSDPGATAEAILELLDDATLRRQLSAAGRKRAAQFTVERMSEGFASLFRGLL